MFVTVACPGPGVSFSFSNHAWPQLKPSRAGSIAGFAGTQCRLTVWSVIWKPTLASTWRQPDCRVERCREGRPAPSQRAGTVRYSVRRLPSQASGSKSLALEFLQLRVTHSSGLAELRDNQCHGFGNRVLCCGMCRSWTGEPYNQYYCSLGLAWLFPLFVGPLKAALRPNPRQHGKIWKSGASPKASQALLLEVSKLRREIRELKDRETKMSQA